MKNTIIYASLALASAVLLVSACGQRNNTTSDEQRSSVASKSTIDVIHERTSIRTYTDEAVPEQDLEMLVRAGMAAPSAMNKQPWHFIVVDDMELLNELGSIPTSKMVQKAPAAILVCGDMNKAGEGWLREYWIQDCSAATQNILLAATATGLGAVWTSVYPAVERMEKVAGILDLPSNIVPLNIIALGFPSRHFDAKDKWDPANLSRNKWNRQ